MRNTKKIAFLSFLISGSLQAFSKPIKWNPTLSIFESYTMFKNYDVLNDGKFETNSRTFNFGMALTHKFPINSQYFLRTGLSYQNFKKTVYGLNQIKELVDYPAPFYWKYKYAAYTIPVHFGKNLQINNQHRGDYFVGINAGLLSTTSSEIGTQSSQPFSSYFYEMINGTDFSNEKLHNIFNANFEAGINYIPIKTLPRLNIGAAVSFQLNKTATTKHTAQESIPSLGYEYNYNLEQQQRMTSYTISLGYTF